MTRRSLLTLLAAGLASILFAPARHAAAGLAATPGGPTFTSIYSSLFSDPEGARAIGRRYLALFPAEADRRALAAGLGLGDVASADAAGLRAGLAARRRRDFAEGDTVLLDGWILARSEARACALLALLPRG